MTLDVVDELALGELELEQSRVGAGGVERGDDLVDEARVADLPRADVDRQGGVRHARVAGPARQLRARAPEDPLAEAGRSARFLRPAR